jgi:hypothetical protein
MDAEGRVKMVKFAFPTWSSMKGATKRSWALQLTRFTKLKISSAHVPEVHHRDVVTTCCVIYKQNLMIPINLAEYIHSTSACPFRLIYDEQ